MNVVDIIIIIFLMFGFLIGWKRGFTRQILAVVGIFVSIILSYFLKDFVSTILYKICPFFNFGGYFEGVTALNLVIYEVLAFILVFSFIFIIYKIIIKLSSIIEKILNFTIILGIPGKILGGVAGVIENFIITFIVLYVLNLPILDFPYIKDSNIGKKILNNTPVMSDICSDTIKVYDEIAVLKDKYRGDADKTKLNNEIVNILLKYKFVSRDNVNYLISKDKLKNITIEI